MKSIWVVLIYSMSIIHLFGSFSDTECSDPATDLLDQLKEKYTTTESVTIDFSLTIKLAERAENQEKGQLVQQGESFKVTMKDQDIYCDGNDLWYHLKPQNEVQINDYEGGEDVGVFSPADLLNQYESGAFIYAITNEHKKGNQHISEIEFKPTDEFSDYSKLRAVIDVDALIIKEVFAFGKDGSRFTMTLDKEEFGVNYDSSFFTWDADKHPDVNVEDLRLD